jgi:phosphoribosyl-ATP pyrophosphohydrolase
MAVVFVHAVSKLLSALTHPVLSNCNKDQVPGHFSEVRSTRSATVIKHNAPVPKLFSYHQTTKQSVPTGGKPSWTAKLLSDPSLLCSKIREEAGELCETLEKGEGAERTMNEAADLLYHCMVLLNHEGVHVEDVLRELRKRFGTSGITEKAAR